MKYWLLFFGVSITIIFGGGFLNRLVKDGKFFIAEFIVRIIGIILLLIELINKDSIKPYDT